MIAILTAWLPLVGALAGAIGVAVVWKRITPAMSWQRMLRFVVVPVAFVATFLALSTLAVALVSGDVVRTYLVDGSRGPVLWQVNTIVVFEGDDDTIERTRLDIRDVDTGRRVKRIDYVRWWAVPVVVDVLGEGRDFMWLYSERDGLHTRDAYDGHWLRGQHELLGDVTIAGRSSLEYDPTTRGLSVRTSAGMRFLDPSSLALSPQPAAEAPNRFAARVDNELTLAGTRYVLQDGQLRRLATGAFAWQPLGTGQLRDGYFVISASLQAGFPHAFFVAHEGSLSRVDDDGRVRWTQRGVLDSRRVDMDYAFARNGKVCLVQDDRLACFAADGSQAQWVIR